MLFSNLKVVSDSKLDVLVLLEKFPIILEIIVKTKKL